MNVNSNVLIVSSEGNRRITMREDLADAPVALYEADSALAALCQLEQAEIDVVLVDSSIGDLSHDELLAEVGRSFPQIRRIAISTRQEVIRTINALSEGTMENYVVHPWNPSQLVKLVRSDMNTDCKEDPIESRVRELKRQIEDMSRAGGAIAPDDTAVASRTRLEPLARLYQAAISERSPRKVNLCERVGEIVEGIATAFGLPEERVEKLKLASALHRLGELSLPAQVADRCFLDMSMDDLASFRSYPKISARVVGEHTKDVDLVAILSMHRDFYLDQQLSADDHTPEHLLDAQILCAATEYEEMMLMKDRAEPEVIRRFMVRSQGLRYNPDVIQKLFEIV